MEQTEHYRHEIKYDITYLDYLALRQRIRTVMKQDSHVRADGTYLIRSIYFDNVADKALYEKREGVAVREKFRIRYYNDDLSFLCWKGKLRTIIYAGKRVCQSAMRSVAEFSMAICWKLQTGMSHCFRNSA